MMLGIACGDALGAPVEMKSARKIRRLHKGVLRDLKACRGKEKGLTTDDTALSVCMAESLLASDGYNPQSAFEHYLHWFFLDGHGMGSNTKFVFQSADSGGDPREAAELFSHLRPNRAVSNGGLMRTGPLGAWYLNDTQNMETYTRLDASLTHHHPLSAHACVAYNRLLAEIMHEEALGSSHEIPVVEASLRSRRNVARDLVANGKGMVLVSLAAASWAAREASSLEAGIVEVVNWGGDADSNGAIAGGLLGAKFGIGAVPKRWMDDLQETDYFIELADRLYESRPA
jgi:ADP-ribosyl-[dinitrogen reductase] hydrolase